MLEVYSEPCQTSKMELYVHILVIIFPVMCSDADANVEAICGPGATSCTGSVRNPICQCDHTSHFVPALDSKSCLLGKKTISAQQFMLIARRYAKLLILFKLNNNNIRMATLMSFCCFFVANLEQYQRLFLIVFVDSGHIFTWKCAIGTLHVGFCGRSLMDVFLRIQLTVFTR